MAKKLKRDEETRRDFRYKKYKGDRYDYDVELGEIPYLPPPFGFMFTGKQYQQVIWLEQHSKEFKEFINQISEELAGELQRIETHYNELTVRNPKMAVTYMRKNFKEQVKAHKTTGASIKGHLSKFDKKQAMFEIWLSGYDFEMNEDDMAQILQSEIFGTGNEAEIMTVAWCVMNRLWRNDIKVIDLLFDLEGNPKKIPFNRSQKPTQKCKDWVWSEFFSGMRPDITKGSTHYYSPRGMPKPGQENTGKFKGMDIQGGIVKTPGVGEHFAPGWIKQKGFKEVTVPEVRENYLRVYKVSGKGKVY